MKKLIFLLKIVLLLIIIIAPAPLGLIQSPIGISIAVAALGLIWYIGCIISNCIYMTRRTKKITDTAAEYWQDYFEKKREEIRANSERERTKVVLQVRLSLLYGISLIIAAFFIAFGLAMLINHFMLLDHDLAQDVWGRIVLLVGTSAFAFAIFGIVPSNTVIFATGNNGPGTQSNDIKREEYPVLYSIAQRAADAVGYSGKFLLCKDLYDRGICISEDFDTVHLFLSPTETSLMTESELYTVFLHEFAHVVSRDTKWLTRFENAKAKFEAKGNSLLSKLKALLFAKSYDRISDTADDYIRFNSLLSEQRADEAVTAYGNAQDYINCTAKGMMLARYFAARRPRLDFDIFESEEPITDYYAYKRKLFEEILPEEGERLKEVVLRTLPGKSDSHPTLSMRMKNLGVNDCDISARADGKFFEELTKFVADCGKERAQDKDSWKEERKNSYLEVKERLEKFEAKLKAGNTPDKYELWQSLFDYHYSDPQKAIELADKILESDPENRHAYAVKGIILCENDRLEGIEILHRAVFEANIFNILPLYDSYGYAVLRSGDEHLLEQLRAEQAEIAQRAMDCVVSRYKLKKPSPKQIAKCDLTQSEIDDMCCVLQDYGDDLSQVYIAKQSNAKMAVYVVVYQMNKPASHDVDGSFFTFLHMLEKADKFFIPYCGKDNLAAEVRRVGVKLK